MTTIFHDMMHKELEIYVDDMVAKYAHSKDHVSVLRKVFQRLRKFQLKLNPNKCLFGAKSGKLIGFVVSNRGIKCDPLKAKAIIEMSPPRTEKEIRGFLGRLEYISRFINQLTPICEPIFKLLTKNVPTVWNHECQEAFEKIQKYLTSPPVLVSPTPGISFILYLSVTETSMGTMLGKYHEESGKERAIYYISKTLSGYESKYTMLEKTCLTLVWATQCLRHYMLSHKIQLQSRMDPIKYLFEKPVLSGRTSKWQLLLFEFDITYITKKSVKGRAIAYHLASHPLLDNTGIKIQFPDEWVMYADVAEDRSWKMYFDGARKKQGRGVGALLESPKGIHKPIVIRICFPSSNNVAEYEACIAGLKPAIEINVKSIIVYEDSLLIIKQNQKEWRVNEQLSQYHTYLEELTKKFDHIECHHIYGNKNHDVNALAVLASWLAVPEGMTVEPIEIGQRDEHTFCYAIQVVAEQLDGVPWFFDIRRYAVPHEIISDNGSNFIGEETKELLGKYKIKHHLASPYRPQTNGAVEAANKTLVKILKKMTDTYTDWSEKLPYALWSYRTLICTATGATPFSLTYGMEAMHPIEVEIPTLRVLKESQLPEDEWVKVRVEQLNLIDEKRLAAT
ncbi:uncharacterized protein LOC113348860 [Papaver somniferum]|uniref:uncharacterized protein LOC113348860 n=1 Tax=Papaver somniferum TaxID=3469 RepID=UPI000E6F495F|nr:uncharacterized protein LOC113348860 [Papaver somniferum]